MSKFLFILISVLLIGFILHHGVNRLNSVGRNVYSAYQKSCDPETVKLEKSTFFSIPTEVEVSGWNCAGPNSGGSGYTARIWTHFFWSS